ncbi:MAG: alpha/beta fold hydrolase, partial [Actinobacteria bacterium]|nr:alpha/beta fold hydrolase [Actinomycetota bacterium]
VEQIYAYRLANRPALAAWTAQAGAATGFESRDRLGGIRAPTLVLTGTADNVIDHRNSELLAEGIPGARLERFDGGGHLFLWEEPEHFAAVAGDFLAEGGA